MSKSASAKFVKGAALLSIAGLIVKILGAVYRIPLVGILGDEGISYYQTAYPIYTLLLAVSTTGLPVAIAKMISERIALEDHYNADRIFKLTATIMVAFGVLTSSIMYFFADTIVNTIENPNAYHSLIALVPALLIAPILSAFRGYFQGRQNMLPTAVSQITEQVARVGVGLYLSVALLDMGLPIAAGGASFGGSVGSSIGVLTMLVFYFQYRHKRKNELENSKHLEVISYKRLVKELLYIAIPITLGATIAPLMDSIDSAIFPTRLMDAGFSLVEANKLHGNLKGMAQTLINFPLVFLGAISMTLVPSIAEAAAIKDEHRLNLLTESGIKLSSLLAIPSTVGLFVLARPIMDLLYFSVEEVSRASAASLLQVASIQLLFLGTIMSAGAILQGIGKPTLPAKNMLVGAIVKVILSYVLLGIRSINIYGMAISTIVCYAIAAGLNLYGVAKHAGIRISLSRYYIKPLIISIVMGIFVYFSYGIFVAILSPKLATLISVLIGITVYGVLLILSGILREEDYLLLPKGEKLYALLKEKRIIKE